MALMNVILCNFFRVDGDMSSSSAGTDQTLKEFYIPDYILIPGLEVEKLDYIPESPVIVFVNSKSGGQLGGDLLKTYRGLLNRYQVLFIGYLHY